MFQFLSEYGRKIYEFIVHSVTEEISFSEFYEVVQKTFPNYNEYDAYLDYIRTEQQMRWWDELNDLPEDVAPGKDYFAPTVTVTRKRYNMTYEVTFLDRETGELRTKYITVGSDYLRPKSWWDSKTIEALNLNAPQYNREGFEIIDMRVTKAYGWRLR